MMPRKILFPLVSLAVLILTGTGGIAFAMKKQTERKIMAYKQALTLETWAVGRHLIDIPAEAKVDFAQSYRGAGADVEVSPSSLFQARTLVRERVEELQGTMHLEGGTLLERYVESQSLPNTWILYRWEDRTFKGSSLQVDIDAYHWKEKPGAQNPFARNAYLFKFDRIGHAIETEMIRDQADIEDLLRRVRIRDNHEIPTEPGFCMAYSFIPGEAPKGIHSEGSTISFSVPGHPDNFVRFNTQMVNDATAAGEKLLDRIKRVNSDPVFSGLTVKKLRAGERTVGDYKGQECLEMTKEKGLWNMQFQWEYNGFGDRWDYPAMSLELTNSRKEGGTAPLSMKEEEAMALWDAMVDSIRLRPTTGTMAQTGAPGVPSAPTPRTPLGTRLKSRERCPQAGIWECAHSGNLSGARRSFQEREEFPEAVLSANTGWFGKLLGRPGEVVVDTTWTLVSYPDAG